MKVPMPSIDDNPARKPSTSKSSEPRALVAVIRMFCVLPFLTGAADLFGGTSILVSAGAALPKTVVLDPVLNNQIKFWGAIWLGYGIVLWWASCNVRARSVVLRLLLATLLLSGLGRALSVLQFGWGSPPLTIAMIVEIGGSIGLFAWHQRAAAS